MKNSKDYFFVPRAGLESAWTLLPTGFKVPRVYQFHHLGKKKRASEGI